MTEVTEKITIQTIGAGALLNEYKIWIEKLYHQPFDEDMLYIAHKVVETETEILARLNELAKMKDGDKYFNFSSRLYP